MPAFTLFVETDTDPAGGGIRKTHSTTPFEADDDLAAARLGRAEFGQLVILGAVWVRVLVISAGDGKLAAAFQHPDKGG